MLLSDVDDEEERELLLSHAVASSRFLAPLTPEDIGFMVRHLSIVTFDVNEVVMQRGELATWVGIVLSGSLVAHVDGKQVGQMRVGTIVGEVAFFAGGTRHADVRGAEKGFVASVMTGDLGRFFVDAPRTAYKLVRILGSSSIFQITRDPSLHAPLDFDLALGDASDEVQAWTEDHFVPTLEEHDMDESEAKYLISSMQYHRFAAGDPLLDPFALNECVCFVVSGSVDVIETWTGKQRQVGTQDKVLYDVEFFGTYGLPCNIVGREAGVVAGLAHTVLKSLAQTRPELALKVMRMVGSSAVDACFEVARDTAQALAGSDEKVRRLREGSVLHAVDKASAIGGALNRRRSTIRVTEGSAVAKDAGKLEVFYRNKLAKQERAANDANAEAAKAAKAAQVAAAENDEMKRAIKNSRIVQKRMQSEMQKMEKELGTVKMENVGMRNTISNLKQETKAAKDDMKSMRQSKRRSSLEKNKFKLQAQDMIAKFKERDDDQESVDMSVSSRRSKECESPDTRRVDRVEHEQLQETSREQQKAIDELSQALTACKEDKEKLAKTVHDCKIEMKKSAHAVKATQAALEEQLRSDREMLVQSIDTAKDGEAKRAAQVRVLQSEAKVSQLSHSLSLQLVGEELCRAEAQIAKYELTIERQRLAAKGLGIVYVSQLYPLKRENKRLSEKVEGDKQQLITLPWRLKAAQSKVDKLEEALRVVNETLPRAQATANISVAKLKATEAELETTRVALAKTTARIEEGESWSSHLVGELARSGVQVRQLGAQLQKARKHEDRKEAEVYKWAARAEGAANEAARMAVRAVTLEHSFGALLPPTASTAKVGSSPRMASPNTVVGPGMWGGHIGPRKLNASSLTRPQTTSVPMLRASASTPVVGSRPASRGWTPSGTSRRTIAESRDQVRLGSTSPPHSPLPSRAGANKPGLVNEFPMLLSPSAALPVASNTGRGKT